MYIRHAAHNNIVITARCDAERGIAIGLRQDARLAVRVSVTRYRDGMVEYFEKNFRVG